MRGERDCRAADWSCGLSGFGSEVGRFGAVGP